jgi:cell division septation protein DedD
MASILLDGLLVGLLIATIVYAIILDRRLRVLRQSRDEMQALLANFTAATAQAQSSMAALRDTSQTTTADLRDQFERGKALRDDLAFLLDRGTNLADRLEKDVTVARTSVQSNPARGKVAERLMEAVANPPKQPKPASDRLAANRAEPRLSEVRSTPAAPAKQNDLRAVATSDAAFEFLRSLKRAR